MKTQPKIEKAAHFSASTFGGFTLSLGRRENYRTHRHNPGKGFWDDRWKQSLLHLTGITILGAVPKDGLLPGQVVFLASKGDKQFELRGFLGPGPAHQADVTISIPESLIPEVTRV